MISKQVTIINRLGLHARAAAKLVSSAARFSANLRIERDGKTADAKSIMAVMMLGGGKSSVVTLSADGVDAVAALGAIEALINARFGEDE